MTKACVLATDLFDNNQLVIVDVPTTLMAGILFLSTQRTRK